MAGAIVVGTGTGVVGTGVETVVRVSVGTVVGTGVGVGVGWTVWVHPAATSRKTIAQASAISNEVFIHSDTQNSCYSLRYFAISETNINLKLSLRNHENRIAPLNLWAANTKEFFWISTLLAGLM